MLHIVNDFYKIKNYTKINEEMLTKNTILET